MGFWEALETHSVLSQITVEWERLFGDDYPFARFLLKPTETLASAYPCPSPGGPGCPRRIIEFDDDDIEAVCSDPYTSCGTLKLTRTEVIVYTIDWRRLAEHLARALKLDPAFQEAGHRRAWIGSFTLPNGQRVEVHLALPSSKAMIRDVISDLVLREDLCLLLVPTRKHLDPESTDRLQRTGSRATHLNEIVSLCDDRRLESSFDLRRLFEPSPGRAKAPQDYVFRQNGVNWELRFGDEEASLPHSKGLPYLAALLRDPGQTFTAFQLRQAVGEGHPEGAQGKGIEDLNADSRDLGQSTSLDTLAKVNRRILEIDQEIEEAEAINDQGQIARLRKEKEDLLGYVQTNTGQGGRPRRVGSPQKTVYDQVHKAISRTLKQVAKTNPQLRNHLEANLQFGGSFTYQPEISPPWVL